MLLIHVNLQKYEDHLYLSKVKDKYFQMRFLLYEKISLRYFPCL